MPTRPIPLSEINTENHGQDQRQSLQHRAFPEPTDHRLVFQHRSYPEGTAIDIVGIKPSSIATPHTPCQIPDKAPTFKFSTRFPSCKTGQYAVRWRIKVLENFSIPVGLRFSVNVYYSAEHDIMSAQDIIMSSTQLTERDCWYDLQLEELTVICPHEGDANVVLTLSNCESKDSLQNNGFEHSGLVVDSVELVSFDLKDNSDREVRLHIVKGAGQSEFSFDSKDSPVFEHDNPGILPISRIAWSKESTFLAALAFKGDTAYLTVWNLDRILDPAEPSVIHRQCGTAAFKHEKDEESKSFSDLSIGLAISPRGEQVAIYQEPKIGQWTAGTRMDKCYFQFCLFDNLLARPLSHYSLEMATKHTKGDTQQRGLERVVGLPHQVLKSFVGYGTFLMERGEGEWETIDTTQSDDAEANEDEHAPTHRTLFAACNGLDLCLFKINSENKWSHIHTIGLSDLAPTFNRRVNCKIMMDMITSNTFTWFEAGGQCCTIWDMHKGSNVAYVSSTTGSRFGGLTFRGNTRMAISPDQSIIALTSGDGNLSTYYTNSGILIDSEEYSGYSIEYVAFHGHSYQVFLILRDNISLELSSYIVDPLHLQSGTAANQVPIPSIGKSVLTLMRQGIYQNQGLVCETNGSMVRCYVSYKPADYRSIERTDSYKADITRDQVKDCGKLYGLRTENIREPFRDGSGLLYWIVRLSVVRVNPLNGSQDTIFSFVPEPWMRVSTMEVPYPVHLQQAYFLPDKSDKQEGSGGTRFVVVGMQTIQIWSLPMEDIEDNEEIEECNLEFIWSRPLGKDEFAPDPEKRTRKCEPVGYKYHDIQSADIYMDPATGNATADIKLHNGVRTNHIVIPPTYGSEPQITFLYCARSIHLLANAYYFARQDSRRQASDPQMIALSDHKHSEAIVRFARGHVNRLLSADDFYPQQTFKEAPHDSSEIHGKHSHANYANLSFEKLPISPAMITPDGPILMDQVIERDRLQRAGTMATTATKTRRKRHRHSRSNPVATLLTLLFSRADLHVTNCAFIEGLLQLEVGGWVPHVSKELNPIALAIKAKHDQLLKVLIDYCIKQAMRHHPLYLVPLDQCLAELLVPYHDLVADIFRRTSYLPAHNQAYVAINASRNSLDLVHFRARPTPYASIFTKFKTPKSIQDCNNPVFALQSQLPTSTGILGSGNSRDRKFPDIFTDLPVHNIPDIIYVCPFQFLPTTRSFSQLFKRKREDSVFAQMAGKDFFDSPSVVVALRFKWHKFGLKYWTIRFFSVFLLFSLCLLITTKQILVSSLREYRGPDKDHPEDVQLLDSPYRIPTDQDIADRYLNSWRPAFFLTAAWAGIMTIYELVQLAEAPLAYISSPYNYVDFFAFLAPLIGCIQYLVIEPGIQPDIQMDGGPSQVWIMSFAILFLYFDMMYELRVFKQLGFAVNVIFNITRRIKWFFMIFGLFLVCFTNALLYILHTRRYRPCNTLPGKCAGLDYPDQYPTNFFEALSATYFFLSGRYEPIETSLDNGNLTFHIMMSIFYFFTGIILLNVLIALMNDAFNVTDRESETGHLKLLSEVITEMEKHLMLNSARRRGDYYPRYIYYCASEDEVTAFMKSSESSPSPSSSSLSPSASSPLADLTSSSGSLIRRSSSQLKPGMIRRSSHASATSELTSLRDALKAERTHRANGHEKMSQEIQVIGQRQEDEGKRRNRSHEELKNDIRALQQESASTRLLLEQVLRALQTNGATGGTAIGGGSGGGSSGGDPAAGAGGAST